MTSVPLTWPLAAPLTPSCPPALPSPSHPPSLPPLPSVLIQSFLDGAKNHPGRTVPAFVLLNLVAPLFFLPSAPFQLLAGAVSVWVCISV